jgi:tRNA(fMet)-specific endonuclease VapC
MDYLPDTNIITAWLKLNENVMKNVEAVACDGNKIFISSISYYETKRGLLSTFATTKMERFERLLQKYDMIGIDNVLDEASEIYANLKRRGELLPDADIFIAIAKAYDLILVTNDKHFERIEGLKQENWLK